MNIATMLLLQSALQANQNAARQRNQAQMKPKPKPSWTEEGHPEPLSIEKFMTSEQIHAMKADDLNMTETSDTITTESLTSGRTYTAAIHPFDPGGNYPKVEVPIEMKINPRKFKYEGYYNKYGGAEISEQEAREQMTDYYYRDWNPLKIRTVEEHYYIKGPDPDREPTKRKFYNAWNWYANYYDGKHGQTTEVRVTKEVDISSPILQHLVLAMVLSGDFTLQEALYAVAVACDRCRHDLMKKYKEYLPEECLVQIKDFRDKDCSCQFCRGW